MKKAKLILIMIILIFSLSYTLDFFVKNGAYHCTSILIGGRECNILQSFLHNHIGLNLILGLLLGTIQLFILVLVGSFLLSDNSRNINKT